MKKTYDVIDNLTLSRAGLEIDERTAGFLAKFANVFFQWAE